ncbi:hypothetical protein BBW65_00625 [Helicobacter enhydrae]|uniref:AbiTii domain-containing protein n=1 Tax=Helicobacter enhydrae TaxID=222136 RepID=A0A1B1U3U3_9HELI|nr:hypothetical protein [Helicobacter enhydrae]ANV97411.1 hypothetical protein BBW65_00625 [Helicobacter enhydrae]
MAKSKIIKELVNGEIPLNKALYRVMVLAKDLKDTKLEQWAKNEVQGYSEDKEIPEYRRVKTHFMGNYLVGDNQFRNAPLPMVFLKHLSPEDQKDFTTHKMTESLEFLESSINQNGKLGMPINPEDMQLFSFDTNAEILSARREINDSEIPRILNEVKTRILDILYELEERFGCLDEMDMSNNDDKDKNEAKEKIHKIIMCETYNNIGMRDNNTIENSNFACKMLGKLKKQKIK